MELTARVNGPARLTGAGLIVLCSYRGGNNNAEPKAFRVPFFWRILNAITFLHLRRFIAAMRDHFANPRGVSYQLAIADAVIAHSTFDDVKIVADSKLMITGGLLVTPAGHAVSESTLHSDFFLHTKFDTTILIYPDALGLTWTAFEKSAVKHSTTVIIANGRRRLMPLDQRLARSLGLRRFLANTRLVEFIWGIIVIPTAAVLAVLDFARGRT